MVKGTLLCAGMVGKDLGVRMVMGIDGIEEGPGMGWECDPDSLLRLRFNSVVLIENPLLRMQSEYQICTYESESLIEDFSAALAQVSHFSVKSSVMFCDLFMVEREAVPVFTFFG